MTTYSNEEIERIVEDLELQGSDFHDHAARAIRQLMEERRKHRNNTFNRLAELLDKPVSPHRQAILDRVEQCVNAGWGGDLDVQGVARLTLACADSAGLLKPPQEGEG